MIPVTEYKTEFVQGAADKAKKESGATETTMLMVPVEKLVIPAGLNVRIHDADYDARIDEVTDSIIANGFYRHMPLPAYVGKEGDQNFYYVTGGFTRLAAVKRAIEKGNPIERVPVVLHPAGTSMLDLNYRLANDNTGAPLKPYEKGTVAKRALSYGQTEEQIAEKMNVVVQYVKDLLYLHSLPQATQGLVISGRVAAGAAIKLSRELGPAEALKAFETAGGEAAPGAADGGNGSGGTQAPAGRVTPARARAAAGASGSKPPTPKQQLAVAIAAIDYALALPGDNMEFLARWRKGETEAVAEVYATVKPPTKKEQADAKRKEKEAAKNAKETEKAKKKAEREKKAAETAKKKAEREAAKAAEKAEAKSGADIGL